MSISTLVLIPCAIKIAPELELDFGAIAPGMIPMNGRPVIDRIIEKHLGKNTHFVVLSYKNSTINEYLTLRNYDNVNIIEVDQSRNLADTLLSVKDKINTAEKIIINYADTFIADDITRKDFVAYQNCEDFYRWTCFKLNNNGTSISTLYPKKADICADKMNAFVGYFGISDPKNFYLLLEEEFIHVHNQDIDPFYRAISRYHINDKKLFVNVKQWFDFGHVDNYYKIKCGSFHERAFNQVNLRNNLGIIRKCSKNKVKFKDEIRWYSKIPKNIQFIAPRIINSNLDTDLPYADIEYYSYPSLNDLYIYGAFDLQVWKNILNSIHSVLQLLNSYKHPSASSSQIYNSTRKIYLTKTLERLKLVTDDPTFSSFCTKNIIINGTKCLNINFVLSVLEDIICKSGLLSSNSMSIIHGDFCLSNILCDRKTGILRLIDPRGSFGDFNIYGDYLYDLAKLSHSFSGNYDFLVNNLFELEYSENQDNIVMTFHTFKTKNHEKITNIFNKWLNTNYKKDINKINLIESILFLSMIPLHEDNPKAQKAFMAQGLLSFSQIYKEAYSNNIIQDTNVHTELNLESVYHHG